MINYLVTLTIFNSRQGCELPEYRDSINLILAFPISKTTLGTEQVVQLISIG